MKNEETIKIIKDDPYLKPHAEFFKQIHKQIKATEERILAGKSLIDFADAHHFYGLHRTKDGWIFREWAPNAKAIYLIGAFSDWRVQDRFALSPIGNGDWEITLPEETLKHLDLYRIYIEWPGGGGDRIPAYANCTYQDPNTKIFSARVWDTSYEWEVPNFEKKDQPLLIYEAHIGMALEEGRVGTYLEFRDQILPRIIKAGYTALQIMAIQEHPYYGSFGYQVSNFFAPSSRFGTPDELRSLIDAAHQAGLQVFLDLVHSHAVKNEIEGLSRFDGTYYSYFHDGERGYHPVWDSRLFNFGKYEVIRFLLSNARYWIDEFHFDGFRFDGVTSMLYYDHGLKDPFTSYDKYFGNNRIDRDAMVYLTLVNKMLHSMGSITTIAEDVSGLPGLAAPIESGGVGFDYRLALGIPDFWIKTIKERQDQDWHVEWMFSEMTNKRQDEKTISYAECHDQALVGDQTLIFRLLDTLIYTNMRTDQFNHLVDRALALHRLIRFITATTAGHGYLNFMGNEFGHPEWIDFPREGNNWSFHHARRLWSLVDDPNLNYKYLGEFDRALLDFIKQRDLFKHGGAQYLSSHVENQTLSYARGGAIFVLSFNPSQSFVHFRTPLPQGSPLKDYEIIFDSDDKRFLGNGRIDKSYKIPVTKVSDNCYELELYLPTRTGLVLV
ncbi:MAG: alpha-amylase family glycosyl hydrolase [Bdellovibrionota bacterium]|jgi:1,4-alpha-glucan branching enzyme